MWSYYQEYRSDMTASSVGSQLTQWTTAEATTTPPVQPIKRVPEPEPPAGDDGDNEVPHPTPTPYDDPLTLELLALLAPLAPPSPGGTWHRWPPSSQRKFYNSSSTVYVTDTLMHHRSLNIHIGYENTSLPTGNVSLTPLPHHLSPGSPHFCTAS